MPTPAISHADTMTIRLYLINLDQETLEVYEFMGYSPHRDSPFERLTISSLYEVSPNKPPGYYIKLKLSDLHTMQRMDWVMEYEMRLDDLNTLWKLNEEVLQTIPHADNLPFEVLYGSVLPGKDVDGKISCMPERLTQERLDGVLADMNRRQSSKMTTIEREPIKRRWGGPLFGRHC